MKIRIREFDFQKGMKNDVDYLLQELIVDILEEITSIMETKRISKANLSKALGTSKAYITKLFRLNANFTLKSLVKLSHSIGTRISIHFHPPETKAFWFDYYREITAFKPDPLSPFDEDYIKIESPGQREDDYDQCSYAA